MRLKKLKKRSWEADTLAGFRPPRRPLANHLPCGNAIAFHKANAPSVRVDECRSWARLQARLDEDCCHPQPATSHTKRRVVLKPVTQRAAPVVRPGASEFSESSPAG